MSDQLYLLESTIQPRLSDEYYTPRWIFEALDVSFDLDVAAPPAPLGNVPARARLTAADDGLAQPWHGFVWMNPPFSNFTSWTERWIRHRNGIMLGPCTQSAWWGTVLSEADSVAFFARTLWFNRPNQKPGKCGAYPIFLASIGATGNHALRRMAAVTPRCVLMGHL